MKKMSQESDSKLAFSSSCYSFMPGASILERSEKAALLFPFCWTMGFVGVGVFFFNPTFVYSSKYRGGIHVGRGNAHLLKATSAPQARPC